MSGRLESEWKIGVFLVLVQPVVLYKGPFTQCGDGVVVVSFVVITQRQMTATHTFFCQYHITLKPLIIIILIIIIIN